MIVAKFGGSSVADAKQFQKIKNIVAQNPDRKVLVVSALGKKTADDIKTTDLLYELHSALAQKLPYAEVFAHIKQNFYDVQQTLGLSIDLQTEFAKLESEFTPHISRDYVVSYGEFYTAKMMADYLGYTFVDAADVIRFQPGGAVDEEITFRLISEAYEKYERIVIPGFYGAYADGTVHTFPRGGSDITGAIVASALHGSCYENWTDVSGVLVTDPHIVKNAKRIDEITYAELHELACMGFSVLHEETISPVRERNIPIHILNTNEPNGKGTLVTANRTDEPYLIKGIAGKKDFTTFALTRKNGVSKLEIICAVLHLFEEYGIDSEQVVSNIDSLCLAVPSAAVQEKADEILLRLKQINAVSTADIDRDLALISVLGRDFALLPGVAVKIFTAIGAQGINIKLISYGISNLSIVIGVAQEDYEKAVVALYSSMAALTRFPL